MSLKTSSNSGVGSRLPTPVSHASTNSISKRNRIGTKDLEQGLAAKKGKFESTSSKSSASSSSNLSRGKWNSMACLTAKSTTTGRASSVNSRTPRTTTMSTRNGLNDRTNSVNPTRSVSTFRKPAPKADINSRMKAMEDKFQDSVNRIEFLEQVNSQLQNNVQEKENVVVANSEELNQIKSQRDELNSECLSLKRQITENKTEKRSFETQIDELSSKVSSQSRKISSLDGEIEAKIQEVNGLKSSVAALTSAAAGTEAKLSCIQNEYQAAKDEIARLTLLAAEQSESIRVFEDKSRDYETERRKLHNIIQELKGNIRVFCRLRPFIKDEGSLHGDVIRHIQVKEDKKSLSMFRGADSPQDTGGLKAKNNNFDFEFDKVFGPNTTQNTVFDEICQLVQSAIDGYNVCVFAYGQTGSGKTHTMEGGDGKDQEGMIPKTIRQIFEETNRLIEKGWAYKLEASFLEIYNEEIRDLLATEKNLKYEIKMTDSNKKGEIYVSNAKIETVTSEDQINGLLKLSKKNRAVAATHCNERSSRSHSVFILKIKGHNSMTSESCQGCLNLVDLAGSERLKDSGAEGARLKETQSINKSLANLSNVIMALAHKEPHVPFRNSKLTHLLQNSLGGNSKTLMFVNISPKEEHFNETLNSLRFATKVNQCQIGTATKKVK